MYLSLVTRQHTLETPLHLTKSQLSSHNPNAPHVISICLTSIVSNPIYLALGTPYALFEPHAPKNNNTNVRHIGVTNEKYVELLTINVRRMKVGSNW